MYYTHQTLQKKSDGTLWILNPMESTDSVWDWGAEAIGDENGNFEKPDYENFKPIYNEFGEPQTGRPVQHEKHPFYGKPYLTPDVSLKKYLNASLEDLESMRQESLGKMMEKFEEELAKVIAEPNREYRTISRRISVQCKGDSRYFMQFAIKLLIERADHVFELGGIDPHHHPKTIFVFGGVPFLRDGSWFVRMDDLNVEGLANLVNFLRDSKYKVRPPEKTISFKKSQ